MFIKKKAITTLQLSMKDIITSRIFWFVTCCLSTFLAAVGQSFFAFPKKLAHPNHAAIKGAKGRQLGQQSNAVAAARFDVDHQKKVITLNFAFLRLIPKK